MLKPRTLAHSLIPQASPWHGWMLSWSSPLDRIDLHVVCFGVVVSGNGVRDLAIWIGGRMRLRLLS